MNFLMFLVYFLICYFLVYIFKKIIFKFVLKKKADSISKDVEKTLEQFFNNY